MGAPPEHEQPNDADGLLLDFVRDRDVACPRCGYNVRNLTKPVCPECEEPLVLKVGGEDLSRPLAARHGRPRNLHRRHVRHYGGDVFDRVDRGERGASFTFFRSTRCDPHRIVFPCECRRRRGDPHLQPAIHQATTAPPGHVGGVAVGDPPLCILHFPGLRGAAVTGCGARSTGSGCRTSGAC